MASKMNAVDFDALKPVALKRKSIAQGDRVRYRVYTSSTEFVAVIAENALIAMKMSGVTDPLKIVRDLPLTQTSVENDALVPHMQPTAFLQPDKKTAKPVSYFDLLSPASERPSNFAPLGVDALHTKKRMASTIDVQTLLMALEEVTVPVEPSVQPAQSAPVASATTSAELTPEEVEKLMNEPRA